MVIRSAPAKINLGLAVHRRRPDGYHDISTIFLKVSLLDEMRCAARSQGIVVNCSHPDVPSDARNLVYQAATALYPLAPGRGVRLSLQKAIPIAAGLGGGSSDAAATLLSLNAFWDLHLTPAELMPYAARLGADVPFFLLPTVAAYGTGRGDALEPLQCPTGFFLVLVKPPISVATAWVYQQLRLGLTEPVNNINILRQCLESGDIEGLGAACFNDLEAVVIPQFPVIQAVKNALSRPGVVGVCMSGSGPTVYALCPTREVACEVASAVQHRGWEVWVCHPWQEHPVSQQRGK